MNNNLEQRVTELEAIIRSLTMPAEINPLIPKAITQSLVSSSGKSAASATRSVNEAGAASYNVMFPPDGFIKVGNYNIPYIN